MSVGPGSELLFLPQWQVLKTDLFMAAFYIALDFVGEVLGLTDSC